MQHPRRLLNSPVGWGEEGRLWGCLQGWKKWVVVSFKLWVVGWLCWLVGKERTRVSQKKKKINEREEKNADILGKIHNEIRRCTLHPTLGVAEIRSYRETYLTRI